MWLSIADTCDLDLVSIFWIENIIFEGYGKTISCLVKCVAFSPELKEVK